MRSASTRPRRPLRVGLISDTHGLLRPEALACLEGSDYIIHAGDIGAPDILEKLSGMAPLTAVRGNNDTGPWAKAVPETAVLRIADVSIYVIHDLAELDIDPVRSGVHVVVAGHSHRPSAERRGEVLFVNPGSAGPRRFKLPLSVGRLTVASGGVAAELVPILIEA